MGTACAHCQINRIYKYILFQESKTLGALLTLVLRQQLGFDLKVKKGEKGVLNSRAFPKEHCFCRFGGIFGG